MSLAASWALIVLNADGDSALVWVSAAVVAFTVGLVIRAWRFDDPSEAVGACFSGLFAAIGFALPVVLWVFGALVALVLIPLATGGFAASWTHRRSFLGRTAARLLGASLVPLAFWFAGRVDERPWEALLSALLMLSVAYFLWELRVAPLSRMSP